MGRAPRAARGQGRGVVRRLIPLLLLVACAQPGMPPGGPPDVAPPKLLRVRPDSNARNVRGGSITFEFDEVISEQPRGVPKLADVVVVSPSKGAPAVAWHRSTLVVTPRGGLRPNTTYIVRLLPGISDLAGNTDSTGRTLIFSTGPQLLTGYVRGIVFDWMAAHPAPQALVQAIALPDSSTYMATADTVGEFRLGNMSPGRYHLRAIIDQNKNRALDLRELFDSVTITLTDSVQREFLAIVRDSLGPGIASVEPRDSLSVRVTFDRALDTSLVVTPTFFTVKQSDSAAFPIRQVLTVREVEKLQADSIQQRHVQDSLKQSVTADSARRADSLRAAAAGAAAARPPSVPTGRRPGAVTAPPPSRGDTTSRRERRPQAPIPSIVLVLVMERPLPEGSTFRLRAADLRGINGVKRSSDRVFQTPKRAKPDSTAKKPPPPPPPPERGAQRHE